MELGKIIHLLIKKRNLTQVQVANSIGKSTTALSQIINGSYNPSPETLEKICRVLEVPVPVLYFLMITEKDIPKDKIELYRLIAPALKDFLIKIFGSEQEELLA